MQKPEKVEEARQTLLSLWHRINDDPAEAHDDAQNNTSVESSDRINFEFDEVAELKKFLAGVQSPENSPENSRVANQTNDVELLINLFDPEPLEVDNEMTVMDYWELKKNEHPQIYKLAAVVFSIPPTETQIERDFSNLDYVFSDRRCSLTEERLEDIMILNLNPQLFDMVKQDELQELGNQIMNKHK